MENNEYKNELGHVYGSRISKNGNWLNLTICTIINGVNYRITCPVRLENDGKKPFAEINENKASILNIPLYEDAKPKKEESADPFDLPI